MKPSIPQGTRDFSPEEVRRRHFIFNTIRNVFELYGFQPLETPSMENLATLMGKYGEEGDRLIFKILNNGLHEKKEQDKGTLHEEWQRMLERPYNTARITERALRYDLTIPFARYVVMHQNELAFPFRRYQIQPVWRADRPQKGRYREFWQCDADIVGTNSLVNEAELLSIYREAFTRLKVPGLAIKVNNRKILAGLAECCGAPEKLTDITVAIDKLDKVGWEGVHQELVARGLHPESIDFIHRYLTVTGDNETALAAMQVLLAGSGLAALGLDELRETLALHQCMEQAEWTNEIKVDFTLARGLNYYTGFIVEVGTTAVKMGSIGGGGRYDDLTGLFGLKGVSGVGVSFGIDRIYDVMEELQLFPLKMNQSTRLLFLNIESRAQVQILQWMPLFRNAGIATEIYPDVVKFDKQMKYANKRAIPYVAIVGEAELKDKKIALKNMETGAQILITAEEALALISSE